MDAIEVTTRVKPDPGSSSKSKTSALPAAVIAAPAHETFEWVQHGDASARKRARAHVTRGFRRQKAEAAAAAAAAELARTKATTVPVIQRSPSPLPVQVKTEDIPQQKILKLTPKKKKKAKPKSTISPSSPNVVLTKPTMQDFILAKQIGPGKTDPFDSLPVKLDLSGHSVLQHFMFGVAPVSYSIDSKADFNPIKEISFQVSLADASAFHIIISVGALDRAILQGKGESAIALKHRGISMRLLNQKLTQGDTSDASIAGIALLAGSELLYGTPKSFDTHMRGLIEAIKIRGGLESFRESNPLLYGWISWCDYAGSCTWVRNRSLLPNGPCQTGLGSDPYGCPANLLASLPTNYDLFEHVTKTFRHWEAMITFMYNLDSEHKIKELANFVRQNDTVLHKSLLLPDIHANKGRRQYIQQCLQIFSLMCGAVFTRFGGKMGEVLFDSMGAVFSGDARVFFRLFGDVCHELLHGAKFDERSLHSRVALILDICGLWVWEEWQSLKKSLMEFFLSNEICAGSLQTLWRERMSYVSS